jgi:Exopolyphosphatase-related proteins
MVNIVKNNLDLELRIQNATQILLVGHVNPDGDCIGSLVGMREFLKVENKKVLVAVPNKFPDFLNFLDESKEILTYKDNKDSIVEYLQKTDLIICMDFNSMKRIDELGDLLSSCKATKILIDHHLHPDNIFDLAYSYPNISSTCEVTFWLLREILLRKNLQFPYLSAVALYVGMMTDTNNFSNSVLPSTFQMAGELLAVGVDKELVQEKVYSSYREERMRFMGYVLKENMKIIPKYAASIILISKEKKKEYDFKDGDTEGFVNLPLSIKDVRVSALFTEDNGFVKVSLRSKCGFSVNDLSRLYFNGGGHERASGGKLYIPFEEVEQYYIKSLESFCK